MGDHVHRTAAHTQPTHRNDGLWAASSREGPRPLRVKHGSQDGSRGQVGGGQPMVPWYRHGCTRVRCRDEDGSPSRGLYGSYSRQGRVRVGRCGVHGSSAVGDGVRTRPGHGGHARHIRRCWWQSMRPGQGVSTQNIRRPTQTNILECMVTFKNGNKCLRWTQEALLRSGRASVRGSRTRSSCRCARGRW